MFIYRTIYGYTSETADHQILAADLSACLHSKPRKPKELYYIIANLTQNYRHLRCPLWKVPYLNRSLNFKSRGNK